ncbi:ABC antibiotic efflux pump, membrane fusion protein, HlyD subfamily [Lysobacter antibioticus]|uniref:HlyD family secretion protein n=1 Tax=Lysobacter antibioticus TaxID=84531 RepID=UPI0007173014|nr:HlyD family secretion protein [Lysobacter antibioticus]ALN64785.1 ABC antibiotic efflux pump, membrane fusion protein, HlyD subfamily [Lysobacter antibioticus]
MHEDLFRREMLEARKERWLGSIRLPISRLGWPMAALALLGLLALLALLGFGRYTRSEPVEGMLIAQATSNGTSSMQAQLWVPDRAIAAIRPGTPAVLRYRAFPYQRYGLQHGRVVAIAAAASSPDQIHRRSGLRLDAPVWSVQVELDRQRIGTQALRAGMRVDAELQLEQRRLYEFVLAPLSNTDASPDTHRTGS